VNILSIGQYQAKLEEILGRLTTIPRGSTLKRVEKGTTFRGEDIV